MSNIVIGISGSIAAFKSLTLIRALSHEHNQVKVILTKDAKLFIPRALIVAFGVEVYDDELDFNDPQQSMLHITLAKFADLIIIAPATANTIAKCANGFADNLLTQVILAYNNKFPILIAPAMNHKMWSQPITQINIQKLNQQGFQVINPVIGLQACGDYGIGCMESVEQVLDITNSILLNNVHLNKKTMIISLGATVEPIDPVRYISNHSSGKMGLALINKALSAGFKVIAICGQITVNLPKHTNLLTVRANTALDMLNTITEFASSADVFISCAAICDYRVENVSSSKVKKHDSIEHISLNLVKNPDVIVTIAKRFANLFCVGFAAETEELIENAKRKLINKSLQMIVANDVSKGLVFGEDYTSIKILNKNAEIIYCQDNITKDDAAMKIINLISLELDQTC